MLGKVSPGLLKRWNLRSQECQRQRTRTCTRSVRPDVISGQQTTAACSELGSGPSPRVALGFSCYHLPSCLFFLFPSWLETRPFGPNGCSSFCYVDKGLCKKGVLYRQRVTKSRPHRTGRRTGASSQDNVPQPTSLLAYAYYPQSRYINTSHPYLRSKGSSCVKLTNGQMLDCPHLPHF